MKTRNFNTRRLHVQACQRLAFKTLETISSLFDQLPTRWLGWFFTSCGVVIQQLNPLFCRILSILCQHRISSLFFNDERPKDSKNLATEDHLHQLQDIQRKLSLYLHDPQVVYKKPANKHFLDSSMVEPKFTIGDKVWLCRRTVKMTRPCDKLDFQGLGPLFISGKVNEVAFLLICTFIWSSMFQ
jgi:hypothetical protein